MTLQQVADRRRKHYQIKIKDQGEVLQECSLLHLDRAAQSVMLWWDRVLVALHPCSARQWEAWLDHSYNNKYRNKGHHFKSNNQNRL
jgi:hypothetical protein